MASHDEGYALSITHRYIEVSDNPAQHAADKLDRQEIGWAFREFHKLYDLRLYEWDPEKEGRWRDRRRKWPDKPGYGNLRMFVQRDQLRELGFPTGESGEGKIPLWPNFPFWVLATGQGACQTGTKLGIIHAKSPSYARQQLIESGQLGKDWPHKLDFKHKGILVFEFDEERLTRRRQ